MKKKEIIYRAIGGISEDKAADAYLYTSEKHKNSRLRIIFAGVGVAALICSFFVLSFVLLKLSGPNVNQPADGTGTNTEQTVTTDAETTEIVTDKLALLIKQNKEQREANNTPDDEIDYKFLLRLADLIYKREDTTDTQFRLLQRFDETKYTLFDPTFVRPKFYYDDNYEKHPVYYERDGETNELVWYKPPYVRYQVSGFPERYEGQSYVTHVDICEIDNVSICGITVNSSFEEFRETFESLGFTVSGGNNVSFLPYSGERMIITAEYHGFWIVLEQASEANNIAEAYGVDAAAILYENDTVPAILRMGVAVENYSPVEQYELP